MNIRDHHQPIVVGIDGSESALTAARWASAEARRQHLPLRFVHAYEVPLGYAPDVVAPAEVREAMQARGLRWLHAARDEVAGNGQQPELAMAQAGAASTLITESATAAMVVIGSRGLGGFTGLIVGSTAVALAGRSHCPIVVVRGRDGQSPVDGPIVVGVDGTVTSEAAIGFAFAEAAARGRGLVAVHTWIESAINEMLQVGSTLAIGPVRDQAEELLGERLAGWQEKYPDVRVTRVVSHQHPAPALLHHAVGAAMVVVGTRGRGGFRGLLLGSTSQQLLHHAPCPVAVIPTGTDTTN